MQLTGRMMQLTSKNAEVHVNPRYIVSAGRLKTGGFFVELVQAYGEERYEVDEETYRRVVEYLDGEEVQIRLTSEQDPKSNQRQKVIPL